ncbi:MAG: glycosyltransferase family protein [Deltaproteobacteria bacterium]|nr:glycosyltransferase family protein [bacterium]MCB9477005.1 glycosyltransferase family protein [Deltaproteobacteria bacterium]MCB9490148.1 glycosyltransferase family protein [Deltaproteobacteria bacterium]
MTNRFPRVGAIIQARTGSSRFPGKVFAPLAGKPLLDHVLARLMAADTVDEIVCATTHNPGDMAILEFAESRGVLGFAGAVNDVQSRFIEAAEMFDLDVIVRICGDSPFIDPKMIDRLVSVVLDTHADYAEPDPRTPGAYEGMEVVTLRALKMARLLGDDGPDREHVTRYIRNHVHLFRVVHPVPTPETRGHYRLSVDNYADFEFASTVYDILYRPGEIFEAADVADLLRRYPEIADINAHVRQKAMDAKDFPVAFLVTEDTHWFQALSAARTLNESWHCAIGFVGELTAEKTAMLRSMGYRAAKCDPFKAQKFVRATLDEWGAKVVLTPPLDARERVKLEGLGRPTFAYTARPEAVMQSAAEVETAAVVAS